jgi:thymidine kinase
LSDWWSPKKAFVGTRQSGKTELLLSELRRFERYGFSCAFIAPRWPMMHEIEGRYADRFGEKMTCTTASFRDVKSSRLRGRLFDVILIDEMQHIEMKHINREILPFNPIFLRATIDRASTDYVNFFDSVYYE